LQIQRSLPASTETGRNAEFLKTRDSHEKHEKTQKDRMPRQRVPDRGVAEVIQTENAPAGFIPVERGRRWRLQFEEVVSASFQCIFVSFRVFCGYSENGLLNPSCYSSFLDCHGPGAVLDLDFDVSVNRSVCFDL